MAKTVLITGASSGIGRELAYTYANNGYDLILVARRKDRLEKIKGEIVEKHHSAVMVIDQDLGKAESAEILFDAVKNAGLEPDIVVNNAGFGIRGTFEEIEMTVEEQMILLNILTLTKLTRFFGRQMANNGGGLIINIASTAAFQPVPYFSVYAATKAYVLSFSRALNYEWKKKNVRVLTICPGATESEFGLVAGLDVKTTSITRSAPDARELAEFIFASAQSGKSIAIHGFMNRLLIFFQRFIPGKIVIRTAAFLMKR